MEIQIKATAKEDKYKELEKILPNIIDREISIEANLCNMFSMYKETFGFLWMGCYEVKEDILKLKCFQGPLACTKIRFGEGVCGKSWKMQKTIIVDNVHEFEGHIACSSLSNSEMVVPIFYEDRVILVLDIDSNHFSAFDNTDKIYMEKLSVWISKTFFS